MPSINQASKTLVITPLNKSFGPSILQNAIPTRPVKPPTVADIFEKTATLGLKNAYEEGVYHILPGVPL